MDEQGDEQLDFGDDEEQLPSWEEGDGETGVEQEDNAHEEEQEDDELAGFGECGVHAGSC